MSLYNSLTLPINSKLTDFYNRYINSERLEELGEFNYIESFYNDYLATLKESHQDFSSLSMINYETLNPVISRLNVMLKELGLLSRWIYSENQDDNSLLLMYFNKQDLMHKQIVNLMKRIQQKLFSLEQSSNSFIFTFVETFLTLDNVFNLTNKQSLNIDIYSELATLPILTTTSVKIKDIAIGSNSNGLSGEFNSLKNVLLDNLIDGSVSTGFSYHKTETGPLILNLIFTLTEESIINEIRIIPFEILGNSDYYVKDIQFLSDYPLSTSIKKLLNEKQQSLKIKTNTHESQNIIKFLPVKCSKISITFEQKNYYKSSDSLVKVYGISIKDIGFFKIKYADKGIVESTVISNVENLNSAQFWIDIFPRTKRLYNYTAKYTEDNGSSYKEFLFDATNKSSLSFLAFNAKDFKYEFELRREDANFLTADNFEEEITVFNIFSITKRISSSSSPAYINFDNVYIEDTLKVVEPKLAYVTETTNKFLKLGTILPGSTSVDVIFDLKFSLKDYNILMSELFLYCENILWERVNSINELSYGKYYLHPDLKRIQIKYESDPGFKRFTFRIKPSNLKITKNNNGYYCNLNRAFDYDKNNISMYLLSDINTQQIDLLPPNPNNGYYSLTQKNIREVTFVLSYTLNSTDYIIVTDKSKFLLDANTGSLQVFDEEIRSAFIRCKYYYKERKDLDKDEYEIYFKDKKALGFYLPESKKSLLREIDPEIMFDSRYNKFCKIQKENYVKDSFIIEDLFKNHYENEDADIVYFAKNPKEVSYINGYSEFQALDVLTERLNDEFFDENDLFETNYYKFFFRISRVPFEDYYYDLKVLDSRGNLIGTLKKEETLSLENASTLIDTDVSLGYYNPETLLCVILVDKRIYSNHSNNFICKYSSLKNTEQQFFKYSIDYEKCIIHTNKPLYGSFKLKASVSDLYAEYALVKYLERWEYDPTTKDIVIQDLDEINNEEKTVKIFYNQNKDGINIEALKDYFSPLLYSINVGFN